MKRFKFKLQPLLKYRGHQERMAQQDTARANMEVTACEKRIHDLEQVHDYHLAKMERVIDKGVNAVYFKQYHQYIGSVETGIENEGQQKIKLEKILKEKLIALQKKSVDKKVIELYREKLSAEYTKKMLVEEQKELDELSSLKTARALSNETI